MPLKQSTKLDMAVILCALLTVFTAIEGTFVLELQYSIVFFLLIFLTILLLADEGIGALFRRRNAASALSHIGLLIIFLSRICGAPYYADLKMTAVQEEERSTVWSEDGRMSDLPFKVRLKEFRIDCYEDGISPKQYESTIFVDGVEKKTSVNHPCFHEGWMIYQHSFDDDGGSTLQLVRDPFMLLTFLGMLLLAIGSCLSVRRVWKSPYVWVAALVLALAFGIASVARIRFGTLVPALRSLWFIPHLIAYMLAYSMLALSCIAGAASFFRKDTQKLQTLSSQLLWTSSTLLLLGMLSGAVWAKFAWGDFWGWDPKECWAAATWLLTLAATHSRDFRAGFIYTLIAFLAMQITWYGVNWLPSANMSMHNYK